MPLALTLKTSGVGSAAAYELKLPSLRELAKFRTTSTEYVLPMPQRKRDQKLAGKLGSRILGPEILLRPLNLADVEDKNALTEADIRRLATVTNDEKTAQQQSSKVELIQRVILAPGLIDFEASGSAF